MDEDDIVVTPAMRRAVNREDCEIGGHDFDIVVNMAGEPVDVVCHRCGMHWIIEARARS